MAQPGQPPVPVPQPNEEAQQSPLGSPQGGASAAQGDGEANPFVQLPQGVPFVFGPQGSAAGAQAAAPPPGPATLTMDSGFQNMMTEMLRQQAALMAQNQQLVSTMLRRMDLEEERRNRAEEAAAAAEEAKKAATAAASSGSLDPFSYSAGAVTSPDVPATSSGSSYVPSNRAEKYLPPLPMIAHQDMGKNRMKEIETWHQFLETMSSWLALQDEAYVREIQLCLTVSDEIQQGKLPQDTASRSAKLFYYLTQSLAKWDRGAELLRSCSKRQGMSAVGYEAVRTIHKLYSIVSRMEAVYVREGCLKLHTQCSHLKKPMDIIRHLEDELAKAELKLSNFSELKLTEADKVTVLLQAIPADARQYVVLHGKAGSWKDLTDSLRYYEEQLRLCETPASSSRAMNSEVLCEHCGKKGHRKKDCWSLKKEQKAAEQKGGKGDKGGKGGKDPKGSSTGKDGGKNSDSKGKSTQKGGKPDGKNAGKGKKKKKKTKDGKSRAMTEGASEPESEASSAQGSVMGIFMGMGSWFGDRERVLSPLQDNEGTENPEGVVASRSSERSSEKPISGSLGTVASRCSRAEVERLCSQASVDLRDMWLVDSGATCHVVSYEFLSSFRVLREHSQKPVLYNASNVEINVRGVVDLEVQFGNLNLTLEQVVVADVAFNAISPYSAAMRGWRCHLFRTGSRLFKGKKTVRLQAVNRAWWAVSGQTSKALKPKKAVENMELDKVSALSLSGGTLLSGASTAGAKEEEKKQKAKPAPTSASVSSVEAWDSGREKKKKSSNSVSKLDVSDTPFAYLVRGMRHEYPRVAKSFPEASREKSVPEESVHFALCRNCAWIGKLRLLGSLTFGVLGMIFLSLIFLSLIFLSLIFLRMSFAWWLIFLCMCMMGIECA